METTNATETAPKTYARRTYTLAGIPCLCYAGALYAPHSGVSAILGNVTVEPVDEYSVFVSNSLGGEHWYRESRGSIKERGAKARKPQALPA